MSEEICLVTGASGLLGSHLVERLINHGERVRALVRPSSAIRPVLHDQIQIVYGDLLNPNSLPPILKGVKTVYHCAAQLGDWGRWPDFVSGSVMTTRNLVQASNQAEVCRFLHVSSIAIYGRPAMPARRKLWNEHTPPGQNFRWFDYYGRAKLAAESEAHRLGRRTTIVRPTWIYGPRDRTVLPRMIQALRDSRVAIVGSGNNLLNLASTGEITQQQFFDRIADWLHVRRVKQRVPFYVADLFAFLLEIVGRATGRSRPPLVTRSGIALLRRPVLHSSEKALRLLGWNPRVSVEDGLLKTLESMTR